MPYLGKQAEEGGALIRTHEFLQGTDTSTGTTAFTVASTGGDYVRVFLNGVLLQEGASNDYTKTTSAVTIVGTAPADGDILKIDVYESITIWDTVPATGGAYSGNVSFGDNNITNVGDISLDTISADGSSITINDVIKGSANNTDITGTIDPAASTTTVTGVGTSFLTEATVGDQLVLHQGTANEETRTITAIASDTSLTVNATFTDNANDTTPEIHPASFVVTDDSNGIDFLIDTDGNIETSTTGKVKQKGAFMQSSTHQALTLGG